MPYVSSIERLAREEGLEEGLLEGITTIRCKTDDTTATAIAMSTLAVDLKTINAVLLMRPPSYSRERIPSGCRLL